MIEKRCVNGAALVTALFLFAHGLALAQPADKPAYPGPERLRVLVITMPHDLPGGPLAERSLLECLTDIRFTPVEIPHVGNDRAVDLSTTFAKAPHLVEPRRQEILRRLKEPWDAIIYAVSARGARSLDQEIYKALAAAVARGEKLIWMGGNADPATLAPELAGLLPFHQRGAPAEYAGVDPLAGMGLGQVGLSSRGVRPMPVSNGFAVVHSYPAARGNPVPMVAYRRFGKGAVLALETQRNSLFVTMTNAEVDGDLVWARAFERLIRFVRDGNVPPAVRIAAQALVHEVQNGAAGGVLEGKAVPMAVRFTLNGPAGTVVRLEQSDQRGSRNVLAEDVKLGEKGAEVEVALAPSPWRWQEIVAVPTQGNASPGYLHIEVPRPVTLDIETVEQGRAPDYQTRTTVSIKAKEDLAGCRLTWRVLDWARTLVSVHPHAQPVDVKPDAPFAAEFRLKLEDPDPRAYVYWLQAILTDGKGNVLAAGESKLYRYRPYDLTEQLCFATWHTEACSSHRAWSDIFLRHLEDIGFNSVFGWRGGVEAIERRNFRSYMEHQAATTLGVGAARFSAPLEGFEERYRKEGGRRGARDLSSRSRTGKRTWPSAALNMFSMGEESGYGRWSESYPWRNKEEAPEECNKWFRHFLRQLYDSDLKKLNEAWGKNFANWDELKVWRKYAEPFGWMFMPPPRGVEKNVTPYVDTHAFHEWYFEQYCRNYMRGYNESNPVPSWTLSYDFTFIQFPPSPVTNFYSAVPPEGVAVWHAYVRSRTPGPANPFHLDWMFFEDEAMNNQFLQLGLASGCTYLSTWGHVFNGDLTMCRPGLAIAKTMRRVRNAEAVVRKMRPHYDETVGIYTFDSRWTLVRGRYGFFLHRRGPDDIAMGAGPYKAPGASFTKPPEGPLYLALTASGYSPKYVQPDEFAKCKVLFMPYVEAIDTATAQKLGEYVRNGGTLIAFPVIAQYDAGGKPYEKYPGAGLDELFGFQAGRKWVMGRYPVDFPGENAAKQVFADAWFRSSGVERTEAAVKKALEQKPPLYFHTPMREGGDPCHYLPEGHEKLADMAKDLVVVGRHQDGEPLFTYRKVGKGEAICFNVLLTWPSGLGIPVTEQGETFRNMVDQLVQRSGVKPDLRFRNLRRYNEGVNDFVTFQYDLPGTDARVLALFGDWRGRRADAKLVMSDRYAVVYDLLAGQPLVSLPGEDGRESIVVVRPGYWRLLAALPQALPAPTLQMQGGAQLGRAVRVAIGPPNRKAVYGRLDVFGPDGLLLEHHSCSADLGPKDSVVLRLRLDDKPGAWTARWTDGLTGLAATAQFEVKGNAAADAAAKVPTIPDTDFVSRQRAEQGVALTDAEFLGLLARLRALHLREEPVDKRAYSYYTPELEISRHRTCQLLAAADWTKRVEAIARLVAGGECLYLVGEDMGHEPESGVKTTPARDPRVLEALQALASRDQAELLQVSGRPHLRILRVGKGRLVLDRRSPDASGNSNLHLAAFHRSWLDEMKALDLLPQGKGPTVLPTGEETVRQWFLGR